MNKQFHIAFRALSLFLLFALLLGLIGCQGKKEYTVTDTEFYNVTAKRTTTTTLLSMQGGVKSVEYNIDCTAFCGRALFEYSATVYVNAADGSLLETLKTQKEQTIPANTEFSFQFSIDKKLYDKADSFDVLLSGKSNQKTGSAVKNNKHRSTIEATRTYSVSFLSDNRTIKTETVSKGKTVSAPQDPQKTNYIFVGWYSDAQYKTKYDFSKPITQNLSLYAKFELDAVSLTNQISQDAIRGIFKIHNKNYNTFLGIETSSLTSQGSGFCFYAKNNACYILTNCHVAKANRSYDKQEITVEDYRGQTYRAYLQSISPEYDLACLYFEADSSKIKVFPIALQNPEKGEPIISVGAPKGQSNTISYGEIRRYATITLSNTPSSSSDVTFPVMEHTAYTDSGSSGGAVLNAELTVIGVHYAGSESAQLGYAIPAEKIQEFLNRYVWK